VIRFFLSAVLLAFAFLVCLSPSWATNPKDPVEITGDPGTFITAQCTCQGATQYLWTVLDDGMSLFPQSQQKDASVAVVIAPKPGTYRLLCTCLCSNNQLSQTTFEIIVLAETKKRKVYGPLAAGEAREKPAVVEAAPAVISQPVSYFSQPMFMGGCSSGNCSGGFCR
jgi:hypothetical protein